MLTLRTPSPFDLFERLEQQLQSAERVPAAEVHETDNAYEVVLELPGVDKDAIDVKATDRTVRSAATPCKTSLPWPAIPTPASQPPAPKLRPRSAVDRC
jgi:HSP20 family protein